MNTSTAKLIYTFSEGSKRDKALLGGKGANLAEMNNIGLPVPPGFTITTEACRQYFEFENKIPESTLSLIAKAMVELEKSTGKTFGIGEKPLLISVRSGASISMPGMMDTVLNLGLNDETVLTLAQNTQNDRLAWDSYRRFIQMFGEVVMGINGHTFSSAMEVLKEQKGVEEDTDLDTQTLQTLVATYQNIIHKKTGKVFPQHVKQQLFLTIEAVFRSWNNERAIEYRRIHEIPNHIGTAVTIQAMVFGNMGSNSGTGVTFTRNPSTGERKLFGEFLINAQGEDVVAGIRTPKDIQELKHILPETFEQLRTTANRLEQHYKDMQDIEFTIEEGQLFLLQTRNGKRSAQAAITIAVDMVKEKLLTEDEAILSIESETVERLLHPSYSEADLADARKIAQGLPASPGAATGRIYFSPNELVAAVVRGENTILVRQETSPEDIKGMAKAEGILTSRGGMTSHAAVVARGMGKCCVSGCGELRIDEKAKTIQVGNLTLEEGDFISLFGNDGRVFLGEIEPKSVALNDDYYTLMNWVDERRQLKIRTNADNPTDAAQAVSFGAEGIGLCRTEHMFFDDDRILLVRKMIMAKSRAERLEALEALFPFQKEDFKGIFEAMEGKPVNIRLLDPPLHEFLPHTKRDLKRLAADLKQDYSDVKARVESLKETNPMLGHRGCRLGITSPEIYEMQVRAIVSAALEVQASGKTVLPEIMIPLVGLAAELEQLRKLVVNTATQLLGNVDLPIKVGTMIEVPRACLTANEIAPHADFFSFGTNDLTQMTFGFSRDDVGKFTPSYKKQQILNKDPFASLDQSGVGQLMEIAKQKGMAENEKLHLGICGEHGGEPASIAFCHRLGLDYVSCSPYRVPVARIAAAKAALQEI